MRHPRVRRRFKFVLSFILFLCSALFIEDRIEAFVPEVKSYAELRVEEALNGRVKFSIGSLEGGILNPIIINDIQIKDNNDSSAPPYLSVRSIRTNYRIWDLLLSGKDMSAVSNMIFGINRIDANFVTMNKEASGFVRLENEAGNLKLTGYIVFTYNDRIDFSGVVREDSFDLEIRPKDGLIKAEGTITESGELTTNFKATHLKIGTFDIVCDGVLNTRIMRTGIKNSISAEGELVTKNLLLNYKPLPDLKASFRLCDGIIDVPEFAMSDLIKGSGSLVLSKPGRIDLKVKTNNLSISWLLLSLGVKDPSSILTGTLNGRFELTGPMDRIHSDVKLDIKKGTIATLDFDYLFAHIIGDGSLVRITESRITRPSGHFAIAGEMDMAKIGKGSLFDNVKIVTDERAIDWDGLGVTRMQDVQELRMVKRINDEINIDVKKFVTDEKFDESLRYDDEVQLEYKLHPNESLKLMIGQDKDFFGLEHKDKF